METKMNDRITRIAHKKATIEKISVAINALQLSRNNKKLSFISLKDSVSRIESVIINTLFSSIRMLTAQL
jgi:hypothetical protein